MTRVLLQGVPTPLELAEFQAQQAMDAVMALVEGRATILRDERDRPVGVEWPFEDCVESITWDAEAGPQVARHAGAADL